MSKTGIAVKIRRGDKNVARARRHLRVRKKVSGTTARPRLVVTRSSRHIFVQVVDDVEGRTLASAGVEAVIFDRGGNRYHGRVAAVADGAREAGLAL